MSERHRSRLYDEVEVGRLLRRAAEIDSANHAKQTIGLSLTEVEKVAAEAGLDPSAVRSAAAELDASPLDEDGVNLWGGPLTMTVARIVGGPVTERTWESLVEEIRRTYRDPGDVSEWGRAMEWSYDGPDVMTVHISVAPADEGVKIEAFWNQPALAAPVYVISSFVALIGGLGLATGLGLPFYFAAIAFAGVVASMFTLARWTLSKMAARQKRRLRDLVARLERICREESLAGVTQGRRVEDSTGCVASSSVTTTGNRQAEVETILPASSEGVVPEDDDRDPATSSADAVQRAAAQRERG